MQRVSILSLASRFDVTVMAQGEIEERVALAQEQRALAPEFDFVVANDDRERAAAEVVGIVTSALAANSAQVG